MNPVASGRKRVLLAGCVFVAMVIVIVLVVVPALLTHRIPPHDQANGDMTVLIARAQLALDRGVPLNRIDTLPSRGPAYREHATDPWGSAYEYHAEVDSRGCAMIQIRCSGPDRTAGTTDDLMRNETICRRGD